MSTRKPPKRSKRRVQGKLKRITQADRDRRIEHDRRTGRTERVFAKKKVIPGGSS